jgi:hypothetical protein
VHIPFEGEEKKWEKEKFCKILQDVDRTKRFFDYLKIKFNGDDVFAISDSEYRKVTKNILYVLIRLLNGEDLEIEQPSFFNFYDFSIIPIEFISNVYELFIGKEDQEDKGAYYTPLFLVDYILKETVDKYFENNSKSDSCVTLDPSCGSGIFLVETLRKIIEQYQKNNKNKKLTPDVLKKIASENIYGIDKDPNAIQVAMFSIYLTLLDYQDPADIETFKFPPLLNSNFFEADFFDTKADLFDAKLRNIEFHYILGNPPWYRGKDEENPLYTKYINDRKLQEKKQNEPNICIGNREIAQAFLLRSSDFSSENTKCALVVTSKVLYNSQSKEFRQYFLHNYIIDKIFELAPVNTEIFNSANNPACVLFFKFAKHENTDKNIVEHIALKPTRFFSYFKIFTINRPDYKKVEQKLLKDYDWLFKTLVYGSYLDFNLINRLKNYTSIDEIISDRNNFLVGTGVQFSENPTYNAHHLHSYPFIDVEAIEPFFINPEKISTFSRNKLHRTRDEQLFVAPMLLVRKGLDSNFLRTRAAISLKNCVFKDSITSIKSISDDTSTLKSILGVLYSNLYTYFAVNTFRSIGIERKQSQNYDKFLVPYVESNVIKLVEIIENAKIELYKLEQQFPKSPIKCSEIETKIKNAQNTINAEILKALNFNEVEEALLDYALNINRPLITRTQKDKYKILGELQRSLSKPEIINYANVYLNRFKRNIDSNEQKFVVRVWQTKQLLGMFFEVVSIDTPDKNGIIWEDATDKQILSVLIKLSSEKITDRLFVQKDIRGFEKDRFYIFKPNEKRLWHKAIAYLDAEDFMDAILRAGRRGE